MPWGEKAFTAYLGADRSAWQAHDAVALVAQERAERLPLLIDQGLADDFLAAQLRPKLLEAACQAAGHPLTLRRQPATTTAITSLPALSATTWPTTPRRWALKSVNTFLERVYALNPSGFAGSCAAQSVQSA